MLPEDNPQSQEKNKLFEAVHATKDDVVWDQDPLSYVTIMPYYRSGIIMVRIYGADHSKKFLIDGTEPNHIYYRIIAMGLIRKLEHAAYLGKELHKASIALKLGLVYVQDEELDFSKKVVL